MSDERRPAPKRSLSKRLRRWSRHLTQRHGCMTCGVIEMGDAMRKMAAELRAKQ